MIEVIIAVVSGSFGTALLGYLYKIYKDWKAEKRDIGAVFKQISSVYNNMNTVLQETKANRFLILKTENGGGRPIVGRAIYASVIYEDYNSPFKSVRNEYQRLLVDQEYIQMLIEAQSQGVSSLVVKQMPDKSILKRIYTQEQVKYSEIFYLHQNKKEYWYCSIATNEDVDHYNGSDGLRIELAVNNIREIFKQVHK